MLTASEYFQELYGITHLYSHEDYIEFASNYAAYTYACDKVREREEKKS
jgi:hypothetical protein